MWQALHERLADQNIAIIAVAFDADPDAARPFVEQGGATYTCLVDQNHLIADLYNMVNVPQAVWIDEEGHIVRPTETAGVHDSLRHMDMKTGQLPEEHARKREQARALYIDAIADWAAKGSASDYVMTPSEQRDHLAQPTDDIATAHAHFRLGQYLASTGNEAEATRHVDEAIRLHPDSWTFWRQNAEKTEGGFAAGPQFWERVMNLGDKPYYAPVPMKGMPD